MSSYVILYMSYKPLNLVRFLPFGPHCIFAYLNVVGFAESLLTVDFGNSLSKAVLKLYLAVDETSRASYVCLQFSVQYTSAVRLLIATSNISEDNSSDSSVDDGRQIGRGRHSVSVLTGRQYVVFTATKIKVTGMSDTVRIESIRSRNADRPCTDRACK